MKTRLKKLREKTGYTEREVAEGTGIPLNTYKHLEYDNLR